MPYLASTETLDEASVDGNCIYFPQALGVGFKASPDVFFEGQPVKYYYNGSQPTPVNGLKLNPLIPLPCLPGNRTVVTTTNTTVFINGELFAVQGDVCVMSGMTRKLLAPFAAPTIQIGSSVL